MEQPLIKKDKPWEHVPYFTANGWHVLKDPKDNLFWTSSCKSNLIYKSTHIDTIPSENREEKVLTS